MLHACFQLLTDFVEEEISQDIVNWEHNEEIKNARKEIDQLYNWWKERLKNEAENNNADKTDKNTSVLMGLDQN